jgi:SAM-dependent methyltransferase
MKRPSGVGERPTRPLPRFLIRARPLRACPLRSLTRLKQNLRSALAEPFDRVVVARTSAGGERVLDVPTGEDGEALQGEPALDALVIAATASVRDGFVKVTVVRPDGGRVLLDARHGGARVVPPAPEEKRMAGKARGLRPDDNGPLLRLLGIANADGTISAQNAKKYKQASHLVELLRPAWETAIARGVSEEAPLRVLDLACGNAYLSFVLADALRAAGVPFRLHGVDAREDLVERCRERAATFGLAGLSFSRSTIAEAGDLGEALGGTPDLVLALHACDRATDEAISGAHAMGAVSMFVVPCCQAELATQIRRARSGPTPAFRHGNLLREHAATLTDALRVDWLEAQGWSVDVVEFVDAGHTPKNRLLRCARVRDPDPEALAAFEESCTALHARPTALG